MIALPRALRPCRRCGQPFRATVTPGTPAVDTAVCADCRRLERCRAALQHRRCAQRQATRDLVVVALILAMLFVSIGGLLA